MRFQITLSWVAATIVATATAQVVEPFSFFARKTIYNPPEGQRVMYPRDVELQDGTILVTSLLIGVDPAFFPVFQSKDGGVSWKWISNITDQANSWGMPA